MNQLPSHLRRLHLVTEGQPYELIAPADALVCPELLAKRLEAKVQVAAATTAADDVALPLLADSALRGQTAMAGLTVDRWVEATLPIPALPEPASAALEQEVINGTIGRFTERRIRERLEATLELPPLPQMARQIMALSGDDNATALDLVNLLEQDAALAARLVGWANSPFYAAPGGVQTINDAVLRVMGFEGALALAMGIVVGQNLPPAPETGEGLRSFWMEGLLTASVMEQLHARASVTEFDAGSAYLVGLLCNFGTLVLAHTFPPQYVRIRNLEAANPHILYSHCDVAVLGMDREMIGTALLACWDLPDTISQPIREQHSPDSTLPLARLLRCARSLLASEGLSSVPPQNVPVDTALALGIEPDALDATLDILRQPQEELEVLARAFQRAA